MDDLTLLAAKASRLRCKRAGWFSPSEDEDEKPKSNLLRNLGVGGLGVGLGVAGSQALTAYKQSPARSKLTPLQLPAATRTTSWLGNNTSVRQNNLGLLRDKATGALASIWANLSRRYHEAQS